jgi:hypothetical protein
VLYIVCVLQTRRVNTFGGPPGPIPRWASNHAGTNHSSFVYRLCGPSLPDGLAIHPTHKLPVYLCSFAQSVCRFWVIPRPDCPRVCLRYQLLVIMSLQGESLLSLRH